MIEAIAAVSLLVLFFTFITFLIYLPAIYWYFKAKKSEKEFLYQLSLLDELFEQTRIVETRPLGLGEEPENTISFAQAMQNQKFAMNSIMSILNAGSD